MYQGTCLCGACGWTYDPEPDGATVCNCTACARYGVLWIYGYQGQGVDMSGPTRAFRRRDDSVFDFNFCPTCGCVISWTSRRLNAEGQRRMAVNLRMAEAAKVAHIPIDHFDGFDTFDDLPRDGRTVADYWI